MLFDPDQPIRQFPKTVRRYYASQADYLYDDLVENRLEVILVPPPDLRFSGHMIRAVVNQNPAWYRHLYSYTQHFRRDRSLMSLDRIRNEKDGLFRSLPFKYDSIYRELIHEMLTQGFRDKAEKVHPNSKVRAYWGLPKLEAEHDVPLELITAMAEARRFADEVPF